MPPLSLKQLSSFSQACHFVHQNMGHSVRLRVYNCSCFQLSRPEWANPVPLSLAMYTTFPSSLNTSNFRFTPKPGGAVYASLASHAWIASSHLVFFDEILLILLNIHLGYCTLAGLHVSTYLCCLISCSLIHPVLFKQTTYILKTNQ